ncbi:TonB-dependent receptor [uncultured Dokdonia sp.]|uniref:TonB-dependent receptor n=1 Tax=uncultured Dokdonia sp. TaxID=575653 RepID=UPI0030ECE362|tara:strand:- start:82832 stop:86053 length:3222 start_codon:yes stop_codon:yes gene_type:complete
MFKNFFFLIVVLGAFSLQAQVTTSSISGIVNGGSETLPGANVLAVHTPTGTRYGAITDFDGRFSLLNLRVGGPYTITMSYVGFQSQEFTGVNLNLGETYNVEVTLSEDSNALEEVVITGSRNNTFSDGRTGAATNVGERQLKSLPTISRSAADFYRLEPSASSNGSFGGRNDQYNNFSLDGAVFNNPFGLDAATPGGQTGSQPISLDAIEQIQVSTAPYDVTLSGFTGASVNAVTKSGTNEVKGTVYGFYRNEDLTGGKVAGDDVFVADQSQNTYGISIGGPIIKNKLFFFANFEKESRSDLGAPWAPNRNTGAINESRVLPADLDAVSAALGSIQYADGSFYEPGRYEGFNFDAGSTKALFKLDWNVNDKNRVALVYNLLRSSKENPANPNAITLRGPSQSTLQFENAGYEINNNIDSFQFEWNSDIASNISNKLQVGYTFFDDFRKPFSTPGPSINITKGGQNYIIAGHEPFSISNVLEQQVFQITNNLNIVSGSHTFTLGTSFEKFSFYNSFNLTGYGFDLFGSVSIDEDMDLDGDGVLDTDYVNDTTGETDLVAFQDFLVNQYQGTFLSAEETFNDNNGLAIGDPQGWALAETNVGQFSLYGQDQWKATEDLTLTLGLRLDKPLYFDTEDKIQENIERKIQDYQPDNVYVDPSTGEDVLLDSTVLPDNGFLFSPRLGFNWDVEGDKTFQLRGGTGIFTGRFPFVWLGNQVQGVDFFFYQTVDQDFKWPQVWRSNIGVDYRLDNGVVLTGDFSYTKDLNAAHVQNWALDNPSATLQGVDNRPIYQASDFSTNAFGGPTNAYVFTNSDNGRTINATLKAEKSFGNGLYASLAYNYLDSKNVNSIDAEITGDAFNANAIRGNSNDAVLSNSRYGDQHRVIAVASKKFEYGDGKFATTISTFAEWARGGRFNYTYAGDINGDGSNFNDLIYIPTAGEVSQQNFATPEQAAAFNQYIEQDDYLSENRGGYAERYGALAPWRSRVDFRLLQDFNFDVKGKKNTIQFSVDVLNLGNFINSDWGLVEQPNSVQPVSVSVADGVPTYTFNEELTQTFGTDASLLNRWQAQLGLRYIFN